MNASNGRIAGAVEGGLTSSKGLPESVDLSGHWLAVGRARLRRHRRRQRHRGGDRARPCRSRAQWWRCSIATSAPPSRVAEALGARGARALAIECDIADEAAVEAAARQVRQSLGPCAVLVNNAGLLRSASLEAVSLRSSGTRCWRSTSPATCSARAHSAADMLAAGRGSIVHVASVSALHPQTRSGAYSAEQGRRAAAVAADGGRVGPARRAQQRGVPRNDPHRAVGEVLRRSRASRRGARRSPRAAASANRSISRTPRSSWRASAPAYLNGAELVVDGGLGCMLMDMVPRPGFNRPPRR